MWESRKNAAKFPRLARCTKIINDNSYRKLVALIVSELGLYCVPRHYPLFAITILIKKTVLNFHHVKYVLLQCSPKTGQKVLSILKSSFVSYLFVLNRKKGTKPCIARCQEMTEL